MADFTFCSFREMLDMCTNRYSNRILFKTYDLTWTYADFHRDSLRLFALLNEYPQKEVQMKASNAYCFATACFASIIAGKIVILLDHEEVSSDILVIDDTWIFEHLRIQSAAIPAPKQIPDGFPSIVIQSSGTTSISKGVMLSQKNLLTELKMLIHFKPFPEHEVFYHLLPYSHLFGLLGEFLIPFCTGGTICFANDNLSLFRHFSAFQPTYLCVPPAIVESIAMLLDSTHDVRFSTGGKLKKIISGGSALREETRSILESYGINVYNAYGLTECSPVISIERDGSICHGSVGQILPCCNVKFVEDEILVSGDTVMIGYWKDDAATKSVLKGGWLHTGDMGYIDENGFLFLTGRISNLIVFENGEKLIPESLENEINGIHEVVESLVFAKRSDRSKSKIVVDILIYTKRGIVSDSLTLRIKNIIDRFIPTGSVNDIQFLSEPLYRNSIGKIDRKKYMQRTADNSEID